MTGPHTGPPAPPDDAELGRMLGQALHRTVDGVVDEHRLVAGARLGAVRIRRRRNAVISTAAALVVIVPAGLIGVQLFGRSDGTVTSAASARAEPAAGAAGAADQAGDAQESASAAAAGSGSVLSEPFAASAAEVPSATTAPGVTDTRPAARSMSPTELASPAPTAPKRMPSLSSSAPPAGPELTRDAAGRVSVPVEALLAASDVTALLGGAASASTDTGPSGAAPATPAVATCGRAMTGLPLAAGGRTVVYRSGAGVAVTSTVRLYAGSGATGYLTTAGRLSCRVAVSGLPGDGAVIAVRSLGGAGGSQVYAAVRVGRVLAEIQLTDPRVSTATGVTRITRLAAVEVTRLRGSGLVTAAAADPALAG